MESSSSCCRRRLSAAAASTSAAQKNRARRQQVPRHKQQRTANATAIKCCCWENKAKTTSTQNKNAYSIHTRVHINGKTLARMFLAAAVRQYRPDGCAAKRTALLDILYGFTTLSNVTQHSIHSSSFWRGALLTTSTAAARIMMMTYSTLRRVHRTHVERTTTQRAGKHACNNCLMCYRLMPCPCVLWAMMYMYRHIIVQYIYAHVQGKKNLLPYRHTHFIVMFAETIIIRGVKTVSCVWLLCVVRSSEQHVVLGAYYTITDSGTVIHEQSIWYSFAYGCYYRSCIAIIFCRLTTVHLSTTFPSKNTQTFNITVIITVGILTYYWYNKHAANKETTLRRTTTTSVRRLSNAINMLRLKTQTTRRTMGVVYQCVCACLRWCLRVHSHLRKQISYIHTEYTHNMLFTPHILYVEYNVCRPTQIYIYAHTKLTYKINMRGHWNCYLKVNSHVLREFGLFGV